jgi:hypothetical protein
MNHRFGYILKSWQLSDCEVVLNTQNKLGPPKVLFASCSSVAESKENQIYWANITGGQVFEAYTTDFPDEQTALYGALLDGRMRKVKTHDDSGHVSRSLCDAGTYTEMGRLVFDSLAFCRTFYESSVRRGAMIFWIPKTEEAFNILSCCSDWVRD